MRFLIKKCRDRSTLAPKCSKYETCGGFQTQKIKMKLVGIKLFSRFAEICSSCIQTKLASIFCPVHTIFNHLTKHTSYINLNYFFTLELVLSRLIHLKPRQKAKKNLLKSRQKLEPNYRNNDPIVEIILFASNRKSAF